MPNQPPQLSTLFWLLNSGGAILLVPGVILAVVGMVVLVRPNRTASFVLAILSLLLAIVAMLAVYSAAVQYMAMATAEDVPKPVEFAETTARAMSYSFCGLAATFVSMFVAVLGLLRASKRAATPDPI